MKAFATRRHLLVFCSLLAGASLSAEAIPLAQPVSTQDLDIEFCETLSVSGSRKATVEEVKGAIGLQVPKYPGWVAGTPAKSGESEPFRYRVAFCRAIPLGAVYVPQEYELHLLKESVAYPGDSANEDHWRPISATRQPGGTLYTLPPQTLCRALRFTHAARGRAHLQGVRLYGERLYNVTPLALASAPEEYTPPNTDHPTHPASGLTTGSNHWLNTGKDNTGRIPRGPISELFPTWLLLDWEEAQTLSGLVLNSNLEKFTLETFEGPEGVHPKAATPSEWKKVEVSVGPLIPSTTNAGWRYISFNPVKTRGLRLLVTKTTEGPVASVQAAQALVDLGDKEPPATRSALKAAPSFLNLSLSKNLNVTAGVNTPDGRRLQNLLVRKPLDAGTHSIGWDLKDGEGRFVPPGKYPWTAVAYPDIQMRYEMTAYPNVSKYAPENSPWLNAINGSGGWMADHTPPVSGCAAGDHVYLGSYVAESGVSLIECDLAGRKTWGHHSFAAWTGPQFLAADANEVFVGANILKRSNESVWAVDLQTKKVRNALSLLPSSTRPRGMKGLAAANSKIYIACKGVENYLTPAASADDVEVEKCLPFYPPARAPRVAYEVVPDPRNDFLRLFRLKGTPPGGATAFTMDWLKAQAGRSSQQHILLTFKTPVALGSIAFPKPEAKGINAVLSVLKPGVPIPADPDDQNLWTVLPSQATQAWDVVALPPHTQTRALRVTFAKGDAKVGDTLSDILDTPKGKEADIDILDKKAAPKNASIGFGADATWTGQLEGMKLLRRRLANVSAQAKVQVSSGKVNENGVWDAQRSTPLTEGDPGVYMLQWTDAQNLRGLAIKEIDGELTKIDVYNGPDTGVPELRSDAGWETVSEYRQERRDHHSNFPSCNGTARFMDGYVDFGREIKTRAVRLRVVKQWTDNLPDSRGIRLDLGGTRLDPTRCRIFGVAALQYLGGEVPIDAAAFERVEVYDSKSGKALGETPLKDPGQLATSPNGDVLALSGTTVVSLDFAQGQHKTRVSDLLKPTALGVDQKGNIVVFDAAAERRQIRVYSPEGTLVRTLGKPGGMIVGPWDPERLGTVSALAVDQTGQTWAVENQYHPKRITVWNANGELVREHLGNTPYGGGGVLDRLHKNRLFYGPLEFELDWKTGLSKIKYLHWTGKTPPGEIPVEVEGRTYLVTRPEFAEQTIGVVYRYENGVSKLVAAMGQADKFEPLQTPSMLEELRNPVLAQSSFLWTDLNGDGQVQAAEVKLSRSPRPQGLTLFNRDLGIQAGSVRYQVRGFQPNGVPLYETVQNPKLEGILYQLQNGNYHRMGDKQRETGLRQDGALIWDYRVEGMGVQVMQNAKPWSREQVVSAFGFVGHESTGDKGLGEFVVIHGNTGAWNIWTHDGLLLGPLFRDLRDPQAKPWSMTAHERGSILKDITSGQEHFHGYFCQTQEDGKYYAVAGHNHISILEVLGLEEAQRLHGEIEVTAQDLERARAMDIQREQTSVYQRAPVVDAYRLVTVPKIDGYLTGWGPPDANISGLVDDYRSRTGVDFRMGYHEQTLYLAWTVRGLGPLKNTGVELERLFKTGASVDLQLGVNKDASKDRKAPEAGDLRLLLTFAGETPKAVLHRAVVAGTKPADRIRIVSPTGEVSFDEIKLLKNVRMARSGDEQQYILEAAIPFSALGLNVEPGLRLKMDWGVLVSGPDGNEVMRRIYWSNKATYAVADAPSEARLEPHLWGHVRFHEERVSAESQLNAEEREKAQTKRAIEDLLDGKPKGK